ncbi:MAG TPA: sulfatase, partial [Polyangiaceae bacterium]
MNAHPARQAPVHPDRTPVPHSARLNILFIVADDLGYSDLGCYGNAVIETPTIDRLAKEGVRFTRFYAAGPACMPTRASILSGKYPLRLHCRNQHFEGPKEVSPWDPLPLEEVTFAETLRAAGYRTGYIGKWHLGAEALFPDKQGFEWVAASGKYWNLPCYFHPYYLESLDAGPDRGYLTKVLTEEAEGFLDARRGDEPFFLFVSHYAPHIPIQAEPALVAKYQAKAKRLKLDINPVYAAMVEALDTSVAAILAKLEALGMAERTAVIFTSDNGGFLGYGDPKKDKKKPPNAKADRAKKKKKHPPHPATACEVPYPVVTSNAPLREGKSTLYEGGLRVPLIVRLPRAGGGGRTVDTPAISMDLYPTFLALAGTALDPSQQIDGTSLVKLIEGSAEPKH